MINAKLPAYSYFDLAATVNVRKDIVMRVGINNVFDKDPPAIAQGLLSSFGNGTPTRASTTSPAAASSSG